MNFLAKSESPMNWAGIHWAFALSPIHWAFALSGEIYFSASPGTDEFASRIIDLPVGSPNHPSINSVN
jgi:hypothetical protein